MPDERTRRRADDTRQRIPDIARELFAAHGHPGRTIADIARSLGTTTAALYYHFKSKKDILDSLLAYTRLTAEAGRNRLFANELLGAYIDFVAETRELIPAADRDEILAPALRALAL